MAVALSFRDDLSLCAGFVWDVSEKGIGRMEARARARQARANAHLLRSGEQNLGVGSLPLATDGSKRLVSVAAALASSVDHTTWCGVFDVLNSFVFVGVSGGNVLADGDTVYDTRAQAEERLLSEIELFSQAFAPADWDLAAAAPSEPIFEMVNWSRAETVQYNATRAKSPRLALLIVGLLGAVGFAGWAYLDKQAAEQASQFVPQLSQPAATSWTALPSPMMAMSECLQIREELYATSQDGWILSSLTCDAQGKKFSATLTPYTEANRLPAVGEGVVVQMKGDGNGLEVTGGWADGSPTDRAREKGSLADALQARNYIFGFSSQMAWQTEKGRHQFNFKMPANFDAVAARLTTVPTLSFTRIEMIGDDWRVYGEVWQ
ncbi:MAG: type 4b pilus protein PilO2 [Sphingomonadaceae bacterium]|nr:type 4b pilus protein PilO2 [Sphingomonadaceae bacterium]